MSINVNTSESRENLLAFLENNKVGVLATASTTGKPHAATIYVTFDKDLNIYFVTRKETEKARNLESNNWAAIAIYNASSQTTLQAEGSALVVNDPQKTAWIYTDIWKAAAQTSPSSQPPVTQLIGAGDYVVYMLSAPSLRLATYAKQDSTGSDDIFNVVSTQPDAHFNASSNDVE